MTAETAFPELSCYLLPGHTTTPADALDEARALKRLGPLGDSGLVPAPVNEDGFIEALLAAFDGSDPWSWDGLLAEAASTWVNRRAGRMKRRGMNRSEWSQVLWSSRSGMRQEATN